MNIWAIVDNINSTKKTNLFESDAAVEVEKEYNPFIVNRAFSYFRDTILLVNELNKYTELDKKLQYEFLLYGVRPGNRRSSWGKKVVPENFEIVKRYYGYNNKNTVAALSILSKQQIDALKDAMDTGGVK